MPGASDEPGDVDPPDEAGDASAIVGGHPESGYPSVGYYAELRAGAWDWWCGATLALTSDIAITAAHCIDFSVPKGIGFGTVGSGPVIPAKAIIPRNYESPNYVHDIAVLVLDRPATGRAPARPVAPVVGGCNYQGIGYGRVTVGGYEVETGYTGERKSAAMCVPSTSHYYMKVRPRDGGICWGDSGSPLMVQGSSNQIVGVLSDWYLVARCDIGVEVMYTPMVFETSFLQTAVFAGHYVKHLYRYFLAREPSEPDFLAHVKPIQDGRSAFDALNVFVDSAEFAARVPNAQYVTASYRRYLGREPTAADLAFWVDRLATRAAKRTNLRTTFLDSPEAAVRVPPATFGRELYRHILGREPSPAELGARVAALAAGTRRSRMFVEVLSSPELKARDLPGVIAPTTLARIFEFSGL